MQFFLFDELIAQEVINCMFPNFLEKSVVSALSNNNKYLFRNTNGFLQEIVAKSFFEKKMQNGVNKSTFGVSH